MASICIGGPRVCRGKRRHAEIASIASVQSMTAATGFGSMVGFCCGMFAKRAGSAAAITLGGIVTLFQLAAWGGYIKVNWDKISADTVRTFDFDKSGKLDHGDVSFALKETVTVLSSNMGVSGAGFAAGFALGLRK
ncbi:hypothetical protein NDN08_003540 [Rhodosorus marinus]|uniref:EF-hand domain-containing protein n=1 Tax=Rhodosorus marinus TaxID=101924 RepID=A0AAV8V134_9RHOD|nr:hypothetical protein NDN08_003540 [Rhodosorus marinus]